MISYTVWSKRVQYAWGISLHLCSRVQPTSAEKIAEWSSHKTRYWGDRTPQNLRTHWPSWLTAKPRSQSQVHPGVWKQIIDQLNVAGASLRFMSAAVCSDSLTKSMHLPSEQGMSFLFCITPSLHSSISAKQKIVWSRKWSRNYRPEIVISSSQMKRTYALRFVRIHFKSPFANALISKWQRFAEHVISRTSSGWLTRLIGRSKFLKKGRKWANNVVH